MHRRFFLAFSWGLLLASLCLSGGRPAHPLYLSLTERRYDPGSGTVRLGVRLFTDDLEDALRLRLGRSLPVQGHWQEEAVQKAAQAYVLAKIDLSPHPAQWQRVTCKAQNDATWIAFTGQLPPQQRKLILTNELLIEVFDTQRNVVRAFRGEEMQATRLDRNRTRTVLQW